MKKRYRLFYENAYTFDDEAYVNLTLLGVIKVLICGYYKEPEYRIRYTVLKRIEIL
jgi:hypothetical protein